MTTGNGRLTVNATIHLKTVAVPANQRATDAKVLVRKGDRLSFKVENKVNVHPTRETGSAGKEGTVATDNQSFAFPGQAHYALVAFVVPPDKAADVAVQAEKGALRGYEYFKAEDGAKASIDRAEEGHLHFALNDEVAHYHDNSGAFAVEVTIEREAEISSRPDSAPWGDALIELYSGEHVTLTSDGNAKFWSDSPAFPPRGQAGAEADDRFLAPGLPCHSLIGRVGDGSPFVATEFPASSTRGGALHLSVNDQVRDKPGAFQNNEGNYAVTVNVTRP